MTFTSEFQKSLTRIARLPVAFTCPGCGQEVEVSFSVFVNVLEEEVVAAEAHCPTCDIAAGQEGVLLSPDQLKEILDKK